MVRIFASLITLVAAPALASESGLLPNSALSPGAVAETRSAVICVRGYDRAHRVWHDKASTLAKYGIPEFEAAKYEDDDLIPVCLGGDNASPLNHWPQSNSATPGAADKDMLEQRSCREVCRTRDDNLPAKYQAAFATDWVALWREQNAGR
jgi:hypothetical protein